MYVHAVPKGVVLQVRNVLTSLVDITGRPTVPLLDLLLEKATDPGERSRLADIREVLQTPDGLDSPLRAAIDAGGYDVLRLLDYIYRDEIERSAADGVLDHVHVATSRPDLWG
jgi:hypothetical protein